MPHYPGRGRFDDALGDDDVTALLRRLARREVSAAELNAAARARAAALDPDLLAVAALVEPGRALPTHSDAASPLTGIPMVVKDNEDLAGLPTTHGSLAVSSRPARSNTPFVAELLALGLTPIAKSTLPEFGLTATTESTRFGATRNPWDRSRSVGGSSGGSAALVAAGVVPIAHANDGGGSIRIPAACCGLVGLKPSRGRLVDRREMERLPVHITTQGVLTRTVRDTALVLAELERRSPARRLPPIGRITDPDPRRLRIGVVLQGGLGLPVDEETVATVRSTARLAEEVGHRVEQIPPPMGERFALDFLHYWSLLAFGALRAGGRAFGKGFDATQAESFTRGLSDRMVRNRRLVPGAICRLRRLARGQAGTSHGFDLVISPVLGHEPPPIGFLGPEVEYHTHLQRLLPFTSFTPVENVTGEPAISVPIRTGGSGLPIGVQIAAPVGQERRILSLALELEQADVMGADTPPGSRSDT